MRLPEEELNKWREYQRKRMIGLYIIGAQMLCFFIAAGLNQFGLFPASLGRILGWLLIISVPILFLLYGMPIPNEVLRHIDDNVAKIYEFIEQEEDE